MLAAKGTRWAIATPHVPATRAGAEAFERGGNAIDAALAAAVTLSATYPHACGVGGDLFALVARTGHEGPDVVAVTSSGAAPAAADPVAIRRRHGDQMPTRGPDTITVPGVAAGWDALHRLGARLPWADAFGRAIAASMDGVEVATTLGETLAFNDAVFSSDPGLAEVFFQQGKPLAAGEQFRNPALGRSLETIAADGADALYRGAVGQRYARGLQAAGSPITEEDLAAHEAQVLPPVRGAFRDLHVSVAPPNSQGYSLLQMLAAIDRMGVDPDPTGPDAGRWARIALTAMRDVQRHLADAERMRLHVSTLLDDGYLASFCDLAETALLQAPGAHRGIGDTIALVAADANGHAVSLIQSLFFGFGSGILEPQTGIVAHNRGACFTLDPEHPNAYAPRARPAHTLVPALVSGASGPVGVVGTMGGYQQPQIDAIVIARVFALGLDPGDAVAAPRWIVDDLPPDGSAPAVWVEADAPSPVMEALARDGLEVTTIPARSSDVGQAHAIRSAAGGFEVGSDTRADGEAAAA
jgi:gamma-glutamyltranspeptidase/glutathione hydrolase